MEFYEFRLFGWRASRQPVEKGAAIAVFTGWIGMVDTARLLLWVHRPRDILAGNLLGFAWLTTLMVALSYAESAVK